jgi:hypothetical protein
MYGAIKGSEQMAESAGIPVVCWGQVSFSHMIDNIDNRSSLSLIEALA